MKLKGILSVFAVLVLAFAAAACSSSSATPTPAAGGTVAPAAASPAS